MSDPTTTLDRLAARAGQLYTLPAVAMEVLELTNNPQVDTRALKDCIENDPALTGKILRVVNSSLFGLSREVSNLSQALTLLGTKPLKLLVLGFSLPPGLFAEVESEILGHYWRHSLTKAVAAREISETLLKTPGDDAFIAGLLQDLGVLVLIEEVGAPYISFLEKAYAGGKDLAALETKSMHFDHTMLSARLLSHWGLPESLVEAVVQRTEHCESPSPATPEQALPEVLQLAELLARLLADGQTEVLAKLLDGRGELHTLTEEQLETLVDNLEEKVQQLADVLSLQLPGGLDYSDVLVKAHGQLAEVAAEAAGDLLRTEQGKAPPREEDVLQNELQCLAQAVAEIAQRPATSEDATPGDSVTARNVTARNATAGRHARSSSPAPKPDTAPAAKQAATAVADGTAPDPGLLGRIAVAIAACRQSRCPLSLLLVQLDRVDELVVTRGVQGFQSLHQSLGTICQNLDHAGAMCAMHGEAGFAVILPGCERRQAIQWGNHLAEQLRRVSPNGADPGKPGVSLSAGVATVALPPRNFLPEEIFSAAERCLYGSHASGGGVVKSIEIY